MSYRDEVEPEVYKKKEKRASNAITCHPWVQTIYSTTFTWTTEQKTYERLHTYASTVRRIRQKLWFYHCCKDHGLVPAGFKLKSMLKTSEAIQIVKATCRRLVKARINDCHRSLKRYKNKTQQLHDELK